MSMPQNKYKGWPYPTVDCSKDPILTKQAEAAELDINKMISKARKGGAIPVVNGQPWYGDVSEFGGLQDALIKIQGAEDLFAQIDPEVRLKFDNDPVKFVEFMSDPKNLDQAVDLGITKREPKKEPEVAQTPAVPEQPAK